MDHGPGGKTKNFREQGITVAIEAQGLAEDRANFHELEHKSMEEDCKITGPCAWQLSFTPTVSSPH